MRRRVNRGSPTATQRSGASSIPAPVAGWNTRDPITQMDPLYAVRLNNWFPETASIRLRGGRSVWATGIGGPVETLFSYASATAQQLAAAGNGKIYAVTTAGAVGAALGTGFTSDRWQYVNFGTSGGQFIRAVNGADTSIVYDGTTLGTSPAITGVTSANLIHVNVFKNRLYFVEKASFNFWYLATNAVGGAATVFDLSSQYRLGGYLMAMGTWTRDSGDGPDDLAVFISSMGEALIYQGSNPSDATAWALVGRFRLGRPIGRRCFFQLAEDLVFITQDGIVPLSRVMTLDRSNPNQALSAAINPTVTDATQRYGSNFGWQPFLYPRGNYALFNVPIEVNATGHVTNAVQYVTNTITGAWAQFMDQPASVWAMLNDRLYFGTVDGRVCLADDGTADEGAAILGDVSTAWAYYGGRGILKQFLMLQPILTSDGAVSPAVEINVDYKDRFPIATPSFVGGGGAAWDTATWDLDDWATAEQTLSSWIGVTGIGYVASVRMRVLSSTSTIRCTAFNLTYEPGAVW